MTALKKFEKLALLPQTGHITAPTEWVPYRPLTGYRKVRRLAMLGLDQPDTIVIHATAGGSTDGAMSVMRAGKASWHYIIPDENEPEHGHHALQCVPLDSAAWHVLSSVKHPTDGKKNINDRSFGIELVNRQDGNDRFSAWQVLVTAQIVTKLRSFYPIKYLVTHAYLDPRRKLDPGNIFPWGTFMEHINRLASDGGNFPIKIIRHGTDDIIAKYDMVPNGNHLADQGKLYVA